MLQIRYLLLFCIIISVHACSVPPASQPDLVGEPYLLSNGLVSRAITFENTTGAKGEGGKEASKLGVGRKGAPARRFEPGDSTGFTGRTG